MIWRKTALNNNGGLVYTALLSPQGKYLFDFFILEDRGGLSGRGLFDLILTRNVPMDFAKG